MTCVMWRAVVMGVAVGAIVPATSGEVSLLPPALERFLASSVKPSRSELEHLLKGEPVTKLLDSDQSREIAVFGAVWINAPRSRYVAAVQDIERFERGKGFLITKRISHPPVLADFAGLNLPDDDVHALRHCRIGDCDVKLDAPSIERFRNQIDWRRPGAAAEARAAFRQFAFQYVSGYCQAGNSRLAVYRDKDHPIAVAEEFRGLIERLPPLARNGADLRRYLLDYPTASLPGSTDLLYWQLTDFGVKPTIRISHLVIQEGVDATVVASKMLYASHYFWSALETRVLMPDPARGQGFWLVTVNRSRSDGLTGFTGFFVRRRVRDETRKGTLAILTTTRARLENSQD
jgi:hypothetical protein